MSSADEHPADEAVRLLDCAIAITGELRRLAVDGDLNRLAALLDERGTLLNRLFTLRRTRPLTRRGDETGPEEGSALDSRLEELREMDAEFQILLEGRKKNVLLKIREAEEHRHLSSYTP